MVVTIPQETFFVGWGTLALINAAIAQLQGRSALPWFLFSCFLGPVATLLLLVTKKSAS